jgi:hypothetical protein
MAKAGITLAMDRNVKEKERFGTPLNLTIYTLNSI